MVYKDEFSKWATRGWWEFEGDKSAFLKSGDKRLRLASRDLYYFAEIPGTDYTWEGDDKEVMLRDRLLRMKKISLDDHSDGSYSLTLNCSNLSAGSSMSEEDQGWTMCNKSDDPKVWVAYSYKDSQGWVRKGWHSLEKGQCKTLVSRLTTRYVYYYAEGEKMHWTGKKNLCAHPTEKFSIRDNSTCAGEFKLYPYREVDTGEFRSWTTDLVK